MSLSSTWLFVPGDRPDRFDKAVASGEDEVIIDLEDAVDAAHKDLARGETADWLMRGNAWVRVNAVGTPQHGLDLDAVRGATGLRGVLVPKAESRATLEAIGGGGVRILALVETALGLHRVDEIAACPSTVRLAFGSIDFALDLDCAESDVALLHARSRLVIASRVAGLEAPLDGVSTALGDAQAVSVAAAYARGLGFGGKLCVHPAQLAPVVEAFRPSDHEVAWARRVRDAFSASGSVRVDGRMVDRPVIERARRILAKAES